MDTSVMDPALEQGNGEVLEVLHQVEVDPSAHASVDVDGRDRGQQDGEPSPVTDSPEALKDLFKVGTKLQIPFGQNPRDYVVETFREYGVDLYKSNRIRREKPIDGSAGGRLLCKESDLHNRSTRVERPQKCSADICWDANLIVTKTHWLHTHPINEGPLPPLAKKSPRAAPMRPHRSVKPYERPQTLINDVDASLDFTEEQMDRIAEKASAKVIATLADDPLIALRFPTNVSQVAERDRPIESTTWRIADIVEHALGLQYIGLPAERRLILQQVYDQIVTGLQGSDAAGIINLDSAHCVRLIERCCPDVHISYAFQIAAQCETIRRVPNLSPAA